MASQQGTMSPGPSASKRSHVSGLYQAVCAPPAHGISFTLRIHLLGNDLETGCLESWTATHLHTLSGFLFWPYLTPATHNLTLMLSPPCPLRPDQKHSSPGRDQAMQRVRQSPSLLSMCCDPCYRITHCRICSDHPLLHNYPKT